MKGEKQNMNKLFTKIAKLTLGLAMAAGVGVAVSAGRKDASPAQATDKTFSTVGGSPGSYRLQYSSSDYWQTDAGSNETASPSRGLAWSKKAATLTYTPSSNVTALSLVGSSNSAGQTISYKIGTGSSVTVGSMTKENNKTYTFSNFSCSSGTQITISITAGSKSTWVKSITITESSGPTKLATPTGLNYDSTNQKVTWNSVSNANSYKFSSNNGSSYTSTSTNLYYDVSGFTNGTTYNCKVVAVGDGSSYSDSDAASYSFTKTAPATYTGVTVTGGNLTGTNKGAAYIECSASATGSNLPASPSFTWYVTENNTYGTTTSVSNKASIDSSGKVTFLDNCTVYVWALAPDGTTHNSSGYAAIASGLIDPKGSQTNPYTVTEAWNIAAGLGGTGSNIVNNGAVVFVTGTISTATASITTTNNGATFDITDGAKTLKAYSISGAQATDSTASGYVGYDYVVVVGGAIIDYKGTYEVGYAPGYNSSLYSAVAPKSVSSIAVKTSPTKTTYDAGEFFAPAGLVITVTYSDTTTEDVAYSGNESKFTFTPTTSTALTTSNVSVTIVYGGQSTSQAITVNAVPAVISVTVSPSSASVNIGATTSLSATVEVEGGAAQTVSWSTSDGSVATVANGVVTGVAAGTATITATSTVNNQKSGSATITVVDPTDTKIGTYALVKDVSLLGDGDWIVITNIAGTYGMGEQGSNSYRSQVAVTLTGSDIVISNTSNTSLKAAKLSVKNSHFEIKTDEGYLYANSGSSNNVGSRATNSDANGEWVFTINSSSGDTTCIAQGSNSRKSLRYNNNSGQQRFSCYAESNSMQDIHIYKKLPGTAAVSLTSNKEVLTSIGDTATLTAKAYSDSGKTKEIAGLTNTDFAFTSGNTNILTVSESGVVTAVASGETTITVSRDEYEDSVTIKVVYVTIDLINSGTSVEAGDEGAFTFTWSSNSLKPDTYDVEWASNNDNAFVVSDDGSYLAGDAGETATITVTIIDEDSNEYVATKEFSTVSTVVAATHISVVESSGVTAYIGTNVNLSISVLGENDALATNQNVVCTSSDNNILTVTNAGVITPQSKGIATVTIIDEGELCTPVVINVRVRNIVLGDAKIMGVLNGPETTDKASDISGHFETENSFAAPSAVTQTNGYDDRSGYYRIAAGSSSGSISISYDDLYISKIVVVGKRYSANKADPTVEGATASSAFTADDTTVTFTFAEAVKEFTLLAASGQQFCCKSITVYSTKEDKSLSSDAQALYTFEETNMHLDDYSSNLGYCKDTEHHYYSTAKAAFNALTKDQRDMYVSNEAFADGCARLSAWATANGESLNSSNQLAVRPGISPLVNIIGENSNTVAIIIIISMVSVTAIGGYFFLRKRKENI